MKASFPARNIAWIAMGVALMTVCAWLTFPFVIHFTMQTFAVFLISFLYSFKNGALTLLSYISLGMIGVPVFSGFQGGFFVLLGPTGGYLIGFWFVFVLISCGKLWFGNRRGVLILFALLGLLLCYAVGTLWYCFLYGASESASPISVLSICVFPFIAPDLAKLFLALFVADRLRFLNAISSI